MKLSQKRSAGVALLKTALVSIIFCGSLAKGYAQTDTIFTNNQKIACVVKEVTPDAVTYLYPGEDVLNSLYKNTVQKIVFKSGRVQSFAEATSYKSVNGVMDYSNVSVTTLESEVKGLYKLSDVSSKAKGTTVFSSQERVKDRAYNKLKIQAAMFGANIILLSNQRTEGNKYGGYYQSGSSTETNLTGIAYSNILLDLDKFKSLIGSNTTFETVTRYQLGASYSDVAIDAVTRPFELFNVINQNGIIMLEGKLKDENNVTTFQLAGFTDHGFSIAYRHKGTAYNFTVKI